MAYIIPKAPDSMKRPLTNTGLCIAFTVLTLASFCVTVSAAGSEPFFYYSTSDALYYVGFSATLMVLWVQIAVGIGVGLACRRVSAWWLLGVLWSCIGLFCVGTAIDTWTSDMESHVFRVEEPK
jgi:hypothetical protein